MFNKFMSTEKITNTKIDDLSSLITPQKNDEPSSSGRVDINILLNRARKEREKTTRINLVFSGLAFSLIFIVGLILSF
tara:strand:+ start:334 stop:567 length:234 start_codon:yes stop_codon:yes gene_type:complete